MSHALADELKSLEMLPMCEEIVERPHAEMHHEKCRQRASSRAWQSCTNRLNNNLELWDLMDKSMQDIFVLEFRAVKRIVQVEPERQFRPAKLSFRRLKELVYRASPFK